MTRAVAASLAAAVLLAGPACADTAEGGLHGQWVNDGGSVMVVQTDADGQLRGRYCSELGRVEADSCHPLTGWVAGDVVGFAVRFDPPGSVTAWSGQLSRDENGPFLRTLWHLSRDVPESDEDERLWESVISGYAVFRPVVPAKGD